MTLAECKEAPRACTLLASNGFCIDSLLKGSSAVSFYFLTQTKKQEKFNLFYVGLVLIPFSPSVEQVKLIFVEGAGEWAKKRPARCAPWTSMFSFDPKLKLMWLGVQSSAQRGDAGDSDVGSFLGSPGPCSSRGLSLLSSGALIANRCCPPGKLETLFILEVCRWHPSGW